MKLPWQNKHPTCVRRGNKKNKKHLSVEFNHGEQRALRRINGKKDMQGYPESRLRTGGE